MLLAGAVVLPTAAQTVYGLAVPASATTDRTLVSFSATSPATLTTPILITGLAAGQTVVGIDFRPNTGELFALGYNSLSTQAQLYTLNRATGVATSVGAAIALNLGTNPFRIGFDFNPTVDRIRVVSGIGTDFRLNPNNGALAATDGTLAYASTDPNAGQTPSVGAVAYTNSYIGSTATTLYDIDEANSRLTIQNPPNNGTLNTVGPLGITIDNSKVTDLDIYFDADTRLNTLYLAVATSTSTTQANTDLYRLNPTTGAATLVGPVGSGPIVAITDIAFQTDRPATLPTITGQLAYALAGSNLLTFDTALPGFIRTSVGLTGFDPTQTLAGLDVRPLNNALYALGYNAVTQTGQLYTINAATGVATQTSAPLPLTLGTGSIGFDFNPTVDRIRVVGANRNNYRLNPVNGTLAATDGPLVYTSGSNMPSIGAAAYTNSFTGASPTTGTTLYNYDEVLNVLNTQATANPPMDGQLTTVGASGIIVNTTSPNVDLDIYSTGVGVNTAYLVANPGASPNSNLYTVNLTTGAATPVGAMGGGQIGNGITVRDIAVAAAGGVATGVRSRTELASTALNVFPNPVTSQATVSFRLDKASRVDMVVFDAVGRQVQTLQAGTLPAGEQTLRWEAGKAAAGLYFLHLSIDGQPAGVKQAVVLH
ncbi:hypothetical protein GCM10022406_33670 [Hymenobacter algoricola]|uniref:DUF4394 domain-containing protein n=1 Tax=Hymenobacter algoricola TaxID=486267 RepID=A0ABP7NKF1_9BACT